MPWTETDYPNSMKNLSIRRRKKAIEIANAILRNGGGEGTAIATGIKRSGGIVKMASAVPLAALGGAVVGGLGGALLGSAFDTKEENTGAWIGAGLGALAGGVGFGMAMHKAEHELSTAERNLERIRARAREENYASRSRQEFERKQKTFWDNYHDQKAKENWQEYNKNSFKEENWQNFGKKYTPPPMPGSIDNEHESFFMKWGNKSHTQITTKAEAKKIYRDAMKKYHPDLNLNDPIAALKAREITVGWGKIEHQPWFEKLASMRDLIRRIIHR